MAKIVIAGIRLSHVWIGREESGDEEKVTAAYRLVGENGQTIGSKETITSKPSYAGSGEMVIVPSAPTMKLLREAVSAYKKEVETSIGLTEG